MSGCNVIKLAFVSSRQKKPNSDTMQPWCSCYVVCSNTKTCLDLTFTLSQLRVPSSLQKKAQVSCNAIILTISLINQVCQSKQKYTAFSRSRSEHTDRNIELEPTVLYRTTPTHLEIITPTRLEMTTPTH